MSATEHSKPDSLFLIYLGVLVIGGLVILASASSAVGFERFHDSYYFVRGQVLHGLLPGVFAFFVTSLIPYGWWARGWKWWYLVTLALLTLVFIPHIAAHYGTTRSWATLGPISLQPAEFAKFSFFIALSGWLSATPLTQRRSSAGFLSFCVLVGIPSILLVLQPDVGTMLVYVAVAFLMFFSAGCSWKHVVWLCALGLSAVAALILAAPYRLARFLTFLHPQGDVQGTGYQLNQALIGIGSGGLFGLGLGHSRQKFLYLPEVSSDSIFAVFAEELGFVVSCAFLAFMYVFCMRGLRIAGRAPDEFSRTCVIGIMAWCMVQTFINIGAIIGIIPLTGVPLPFLSHGGSATIALLAGMGVVVNVSRIKN